MQPGPGPYVTSANHNSTQLTNLRPKVSSFYPPPPPPLSISAAPFYVYLKLLILKLHWKEGSRKKDLRSHLGIDLGAGASAKILWRD